MLLTFLSRAVALGLSEAVSCPADFGGGNGRLGVALCGVVAALCSVSVGVLLHSAVETLGARLKSRRRSAQKLARAFKLGEGSAGTGEDDEGEGEVFVR